MQLKNKEKQIYKYNKNRKTVEVRMCLSITLSNQTVCTVGMLNILWPTLTEMAMGSHCSFHYWQYCPGLYYFCGQRSVSSERERHWPRSTRQTCTGLEPSRVKPKPHEPRLTISCSSTDKQHQHYIQTRPNVYTFKATSYC